jgi:hypothetical protein
MPVATKLASLGVAHPEVSEEGYGAGDLKERYVGSGKFLGMILCTRQSPPENQCVFIRGFRITRVFRSLPRRFRGVAGSNVVLQGDQDDNELDEESPSILSEAMVRVSR